MRQSRPDIPIPPGADYLPQLPGDFSRLKMARSYGARRNNSTMTELAFLDLVLSLGSEILKLAASDFKGVADSQVDVVVGIRNVGIPVDYNIGGSGYRKMDPHPVGIALMVPVLRAADDGTRRRNAMRERLKLLPVGADAGLYGVGMLDVFERDLNWNLHPDTSHFIRLYV